MSTNISKALRSLVTKRAQNKCEYCLISTEDTFLPFHIDHIISIKHGGANIEENMALACPHCNQHKGSDLATILGSTNDLIRLFNPRNDNWYEHFAIDGGQIIGKTKIGQATTKLLKFNDQDRLLLRELLAKAGRYP